MPEETEEQEETEESPEEVSEPASERGALFSPEGVIMMLLAILIDIAGLFCLVLDLVLSLFGIFGIGTAISSVLDVLGLILIGGWMLFRYGQMTGTKGAKKAGGKLLKRLGLSFLGELIPIFGDVAPCWTLAVYFTLKSSR